MVLLVLLLMLFVAVSPVAVVCSTKAKIDEEVRKLTEDSYKRALNLLKRHKQSLAALAEALINDETLTGQQVLFVRVSSCVRTCRTPFLLPSPL